MSLEMEHMWEAMKDVHYRRTLELLKEEIGQADCMETALTAALNRVVHVVHAQAGTFWYYDQFGDDRIYQIFLQASPKNEGEKKGGLLGLFR